MPSGALGEAGGAGHRLRLQGTQPVPQLGGHRRYREAEVKELLGGIIPAQRGAAD